MDQNSEKATEPDQGVYVSTQGVAEWLGVTAQTVRNWKRDGLDSFPQPLLLGGVTRYKRADIAAWLAARRQEAEEGDS